jgi:ribonucleoside-diphosphate reductase beta chain
MSILNSESDVNRLLPVTYEWARRHYVNGVANDWVSSHAGMIDDIQLWRSDKLTEDEKRVIRYNLGFFSTAESLTANNIVIAIFRHVCDPHCRQYLLRQAYEEANHSESFLYIVDSLGEDPESIYRMYQDIPSVKAKDDFVIEVTKSVLDPNFKTDSLENMRKFVLNLIGFFALMEGVFFYGGFALMLNFKRRNLMKGVGTQFEWIIRDESVHLAFGMDLINQILIENPDIWSDGFSDLILSLIKEAVSLEKAYITDVLPRGILGMNQEGLSEWIEYIADRRAQRLGLSEIYGTNNPYPWLSTAMDLPSDTNFFEGRPTEYSKGQLDWDD